MRYLPIYFLLFALSLQAQDDDRRGLAYYELEAKFIEADAEKQRGNIDKAIELYKSLLKEPEAVGAVQFALSRIYEGQNKNEEAIKAAKAAVADEPQNEWYKKLLGDLYQKTGDDKSAVEVYRALTEQKADNPNYHYKLAYFLVRSNEPQKALKVYENLEKRIGVNEELTRRKHTLFLGLGDKKKAEKEILRLIEVYPYELEYRHFLAGFYGSNGQKDKAKQVYEYILTQNPNDSEALIALADEKKASGAETDYVEALKPNFQNPDISIDAKIAQIFQGVLKVAEENNRDLADKLLELSDILEEVHDDAKAYSIAGDLYYHTGRKEEAVSKYEETIKRDETVLLVWENYLTALAESQQWKKLLSKSEDALDVFPNQGSIHLLNAKGYGRTGKHVEALSALKQAQLISFNNPPLQYDILIEQGEQFHYLKKYEKSDAAFQKAIEINPQGSAGLAHYAYFLAKRKANLGEAEKIARKAVEISGENPSHQASLAQVYYAQEDYAKAVAEFASATEKMLHPDARILEDYGDALQMNGDKEAAVTQWKKAIEAGGKTSRLDKKIAQGL